MRAGVVMLLLSAVAVSGYYGYRLWEPADAPLPYRTEVIAKGIIVSSAMATGTVEPMVTVLVGSQVSGTVVRWYADFNQAVKQGDILAELDQDQIKATIAQRAASLAAAKARAEQAGATLEEARLQRVLVERAFRSQGASQFESDQVRVAEAGAAAAERAAQAQVEVAAAELHATQIQLDKTVIRSPIDGVVISRDVDEGQTVAASLSAPTLFTIANDLRLMRVNAAVSETDIGRVREGMQAEFRVDAYPEQRFSGTVTQVRYAETVVDNVVTYQTLIDVDNSALLLRPGMTATVLFEIQKADQVIMIPNAALRFDPEPQPQTEARWSKPGGARPVEPRVFRLVDGSLEKVLVELGITDGKHTAAATDAVGVGDAVVVGWMPGAQRSGNRQSPGIFQ